MGKTALITGGTGLAVAFAKEGVDVAILYPDEHEDARQTDAAVEAAGRRCHPIQCDFKDEPAVGRAVSTALERLRGLDALVNNAAVQYLRYFSGNQLCHTF